MAATTTTTVAADLQTYFSKRLLDIAGKDVVLTQSAYQENLPAASSKTISFTQYSRLAIPGSVLTEGTPPTDTALSPAAVTATIDQWGAYITLTDLAELTIKHPLVQEATMLLGEQAAETIETTVNSVLAAGTTVQYAGGAANRAALTASNVMTTNELRKAVTLLRKNGARMINTADKFDNNDAKDSGKYYVLYVDPSVAADITADSAFTSASVFKNYESLAAGTVLGTWFNTKVVMSNVIPTIASTTTVHTSYLVGRNAYAVTNLQSLDTYVEGPGGVSDPLHQKRTVGWKTGFKAVILNNSFMVRIESGSAY
jgi:N4-gp56 family major capsid protein